MKKLQGEHRHRWFKLAGIENRDKAPGEKYTFNTCPKATVSTDHKDVNSLFKVDDDVPFTEWFKEQLIFTPGLTLSDAGKMWEDDMKQHPERYVTYEKIPHKKMYRGRRRKTGVSDEVNVSRSEQKDLTCQDDLDKVVAEGKKLSDAFQDAHVTETTSGELSYAVKQEVLDKVDEAQAGPSAHTDMDKQIKDRLRANEVASEEMKRTQQTDAAEADAYLSEMKFRAKQEALNNKEIDDLNTDLMLAATSARSQITNQVNAHLEKNVVLVQSALKFFPTDMPAELKGLVDALTECKALVEEQKAELLKAMDALIKESNGDTARIGHSILILKSYAKVLTTGLDDDGTKTEFVKMKNAYQALNKGLNAQTKGLGPNKEEVMKEAFLKTLPILEADIIRRMKAETIHDVNISAESPSDVIKGKGMCRIEPTNGTPLEDAVKNNKFKKQTETVHKKSKPKRGSSLTRFSTMTFTRTSRISCRKSRADAMEGISIASRFHRTFPWARRSKKS